MNDASPNAPRFAVPAGVALYMALVQFLFVTTWTVYVIFLPRLLEQAGLPASLAPVLLIVDQLVFMAMDIYVGVAADRAQRTLGRVGPLILVLTVVSCVAFLLLPFVAAAGAAAPVLLLAATLIWAVTSSALRAPPWVLLSKYAAAPSVPRMNTLMLWGLAAGSAIAPYLGVVLRDADARLPFVISSLTLLLATAGIIYIERRLQARPSPVSEGAAPASDRSGKQALYWVGLALLAFGFQIHYSVNSAPQYLKLAPREHLQWLMPVFWIGFAAVMVPGSAWCKRFGTLAVMAAAALVGAVAAYAAASLSSLTGMIVVQFAAGGAWGTMLMCAFTAAVAAGRTGKEGLCLGLMFAVLAAALLSRLAVVASGVPKSPDGAALLSWLPALCWAAGALLLGVLALRARRGSSQ